MASKLREINDVPLHVVTGSNENNVVSVNFFQMGPYFLIVSTDDNGEVSFNTGFVHELSDNVGKYSYQLNKATKFRVNTFRSCPLVVNREAFRIDVIVPKVSGSDSFMEKHSYQLEEAFKVADSFNKVLSDKISVR